MPVISFTSHSVADTYQAGRQLAAMLRPGDVVLLVGELGAGKTSLVTGIGEGLGIDDVITSPTFVIVKRYDTGFTPLVHADAYRLGSTGEFEDLDLLAASQDGILVIEWGDMIVGLVPDDHLRVRIVREQDDARSIMFEPHGSWQHRPLREMQS
ncbi:MAG: tRNA (adenosine(37)-N6)-threonylcarbamoyltransferase complex ATPase subunit type 1 TsaE [Acidimicrobiia bacterium]|nr:tRNA (adenosine(37)-N6)-threonylcarbamoyltransferase complex ATPase subunit type 1 TsaE [Acidimicrobiia bacterium]